MQIELSPQELAAIKEWFTYDLENDQFLSGFSRKVMTNIIAKINETL